MARRKKQDWKPATEFTVTRLQRNGPKPGQSYESWAAGKRKADKEWDDMRVKNIDRLPGTTFLRPDD